MTQPMFDTGKSAILSDDGKYRYSLSREWATGGPVVFVGLNPSTADDQVDDPTIRRMMGFARKWGFPGIMVVNLFAVRMTNPASLVGVPDPVGPDNDHVLRSIDQVADLVVVCWGNDGIFKARCDAVVKILAEVARVVPVKCFGLTNTGQPKHPLYLAADTPLVEYDTK